MNFRVQSATGNGWETIAEFFLWCDASVYIIRRAKIGLYPVRVVEINPDGTDGKEISEWQQTRTRS